VTCRATKAKKKGREGRGREGRRKKVGNGGGLSSTTTATRDFIGNLIVQTTSYPLTSMTHYSAGRERLVGVPSAANDDHHYPQSGLCSGFPLSFFESCFASIFTQYF
jgi:hypothetical protein